MARKKSKRSINAKYHKRIEKLNNLGITNLNTTRKQSRKTQGRVNRLWYKYSHVANNPDHYVKRKINAERQKLMKDLDFHVHKDHVWIYKNGYSKVSLRYEKVNGKKTTVLRRETSDKIYKTLVVPRAEYLDRLGDFERSRRAFKKGEFVTVQIGSRTQFSRRFKSINELEKYIDNVFSPQQSLVKKKRRGKRAQAKLKRQLIDQMQIVKFKT